MGDAEFRKELKDEISELKSDLASRIDSVNESLKHMIVELRTIAESHTKTLGEHSVAIANLMLEREMRPSKHCIDAIEKVVDDKISVNNDKLVNTHREYHDKKTKEGFDFAGILIKIIVGLVGIWGSISAYIIFGGK